MLILQHSAAGHSQLGAAVVVGKDLAELLNPAQKLQSSFPGIGITRQDQLRDVADPPHRGVDLLWVDRIAQAQDIGVGRHDRKAGSLVAILDHCAVYQDPFMRAKLQNQPAHPGPRSPRRPRMTAVLISVKTSMLASLSKTARLWLAVNS